MKMVQLTPIMMFIQHVSVFTLLSTAHNVVSFQFYQTMHPRQENIQLPSSSSGTSPIQSRPTLTEKTLWRLAIKFVKEGFACLDATARVRFIQDRNYEPPQGRVFIEDDYNGLMKTDDEGYAGNWMLSEDKNDRKDGLWVWGLFEEPKYPFLYFSLDIHSTIILPSEEEIPIFDGASIPKNKLSFRFNHLMKSKNEGVILSDGVMTYQLTEFVKADPLGLGGQVDVGDNIEAGRVSLAWVPEQF